MESNIDSASHQPKVKITRRPALSCVPCRSKKIKCDRVRPTCSRCQRSDKPFQCSYVNNAGAHPARRTNIILPGNNVNEESFIQQHTIVENDSFDVSRNLVSEDQTEPILGQTTSLNPGQCSQPGRGMRTNKPYLSYLTGTGFSSRFFGPTHVLNIYSHVGRVNHFEYIC